MDNLTKEQSFSILKKYLQMPREKESHFNIFEIIKMREKSHTNLLTWLLNIKDSKYEVLHSEFFKKFLTKINIDNARIDQIIADKALRIKTEYKIKNVGQLDIFICSPEANFTLTIENKLDGKICQNKFGKNQIERYYDGITNNYKDSDNYFVFITIYSNKLPDNTVNLLEKHKFITIEYSDIILMLYEILKDTTVTKNLTPQIIDILNYYISYWENNKKFGGYTKIADGYFIWDVCQRIKNKHWDNDLNKDLKTIVDKGY